jgi:SnoaL-like domain
VEAAEAARRWARGWERAWREHDVAAVEALYAENARYRSHPFRELQPPGEFASSAFTAEEPGPDVRFADPFVAADGRASVEWWALARDRDGNDVTIAGVSLLEFDPEGLVVDERDYWAEEASRRPPFAGWGS